MPVIKPPTGIELADSKPLVYLAGPIQGTDDWQATAIKLLTKRMSGLYIASPRGDAPTPVQTQWETAYLRRAADFGVIMFWLAPETKHFCERAYGQTCLVELGEWLGGMVVVGVAPEFPCARYVHQRIDADYDSTPLYESLEETCESTIRIVKALEKQGRVERP